MGHRFGLRARIVLAAWTASFLVAGGPLPAGTEPLPSLNVELAQTSVSGLSSGAYMAGQFHVAFSGTVVGAGIVAGGPYLCAEGRLNTALNRCTRTTLGRPDPARLVALAESLAAEGRIDPLAGLGDDRVYVFSGTADDTVTQAVVDETVAFYRRAGVPEANIRYVNDVAAGHAFVTEDAGSACGHTGSPFINDCDIDQAGEILRHIYGALNPPAAAPEGMLIAFDQRAFLANPTRHGMSETGFAYVPDACAQGATCRVHVAFHGCRQTTAHVGDRFRTETGYNRWADSNNLVILYPEAHETAHNPNACWDWWGYDDPDHATRSGRQMAAVRSMLDRLAGHDPSPFCEAHTASNWAHWQAGRARFCAFWFICAAGSGANLGFPLQRSTLHEHPQGVFTTQPCPS